MKCVKQVASWCVHTFCTVYWQIKLSVLLIIQLKLQPFYPPPPPAYCTAAGKHLQSTLWYHLIYTLKKIIYVFLHINTFGSSIHKRNHSHRLCSLTFSDLACVFPCIPFRMYCWFMIIHWYTLLCINCKYTNYVSWMRTFRSFAHSFIRPSKISKGTKIKNEDTNEWRH